MTKSSAITPSPMLCRLVGVLSVLSLILCVATVVLWARSYRAYHGGYFATGESLLFAESYHGFVRFAHMDAGDLSSNYKSTLEAPTYRRQSGKVRTPWLSDFPTGTPRWDETFVDASPFVWRHLGIAIGRGQILAPSSTWTPIPIVVVQVPDWLLTTVFALLPISWLWRRAIRVRSARSSLCASCGYDLRATPDRCPECGRRMAESYPDTAS